MKKGIIALCLLLLLTMAFGVPVMAAEPEEPAPTTEVEVIVVDGDVDPYAYLNEPYYTFVPKTRLKYITNGSAALSFNGTTAHFTGYCTGSTNALYKVTVYLFRYNNVVVSSPYSNGPAATAYAGSSLSGCSGSYFTRAYCYAYSGSTIVESTYFDSSVKSP